MNKQVLLINDMPGYGKVALSAMIPVLSHMKIQTYSLPTALVSNTLDYGRFEILETTDYMKNTLEVWSQLGFTFDAIATGFIVTREQSLMIAEYCRKQSEQGIQVFCDPIMGDDGHLYNGITADTVLNMRGIVSCADYIVPNYTEACALADIPYQNVCEKKKIKKVIDKLHELGAKSIVVTSVPMETGSSVWGYDAKDGSYFEIPYTMIPVRFPGTGDIFSAVFMGNILNGKTMKESTQRAMDTVYRLIRLSLDSQDTFKGVMIESLLGEIDNE